MARERTGTRLGDRLREWRDGRKWSLREVAAKAGVNHGYLSQLERGDVVEPAPSMLHKVSAGYEVPFSVLMQWAGYIEEGSNDLTPNQAIALNYLGDNVSDEELDAIRAVIDVLRSRRATFSADARSLDGILTPDERETIRSEVLKLLRRADAIDVFPTPLEQVMDVARLVAAGEITLDETERRQLRKMFGTLVDKVLSQLQGVIHRGAREIWIQPDLPTLKRRFVTAHEIGHDALPWQREVAYLDDETRVRDDVRIHFEREANQAAIELLAQGDALRREADDSRLTLDAFSRLSAKYQISLQATARRITEETRKEAAMAIRFTGRTGGVGPYHVYCSETFQTRFGWALAALPVGAREAARKSRRSVEPTQFFVTDLGSNLVEMAVDTVETPYAFIALYTPVAKARSFRRLLSAG